MALNDVRFIKGQGGLGRALPGEDYISGILFYSASLPSGLSSSSRVKQVFSVSGAEALGITATNADETKSDADITFTAVGTNGDTVNISVPEPTISGTNSVNLGTYTKVSGDTTVTLLAANIKALINTGTATHGYTADNSAGVLTITPPAGKGASLNTILPVVTIVGDMTASAAAFSGGVGSKLSVMHYHISEFFRIAPQGSLYIGVFAVPSPSYTFTEITTMQNYAEGKIRQIGVYKDGAAFAAGDLTTINGVCVTNGTNHKPLSSLYAGDMKAISDLSTLTNLGTLTANLCSAIIGQDGAGVGANLYLTYGKSITTLGAALGTVALSKVSDCIAWKEAYNISDGQECDTVAFANGQLYANLDAGLISQLNTNRYIFLVKNVGLAGSFWNDSHTAIATTSDYAYIENNRTIDKAVRGLYANLLPKIASPLVLNADGTMTDITVATLESAAAPNLDQMVRDGEISAYDVAIDPAQNVQSTSKVEVSVKLVGVGVARNIEVTIGYVLSL